MAKSGTSRANTNRAIRQEELREYLSKNKHFRQAVDIVEKLADLSTPLDKDEVARLDKALNGHLRIGGKYLPDLKSTELTGEGGGAVDTVRTVKFVKPKPE